MQVSEKDFQEGTLLSLPWGEGELGLFVGHPDEAKPHDEEAVMVGSPIDFVMRKTGQKEWVVAPREVCDRINLIIHRLEEENSKEPVGRNEARPDGQWTIEDIHHMVLGVMKQALVEFATTAVN